MSEYLEHCAQPGERWDTIAHDYYGDAMLAHRILAANPDLLTDARVPPPLVFETATTVRVPVLDQSAVDQAQLPVWKRS